ncbi:hypothetical protein EDD11_004420 [Mortierella claussenii]|nr:hypothetical protein EDD11_004420 [Mortierella claussenii]
MSNTLFFQPNTASMTPSATSAFPSSHQHGPLDGMDATMTAFHDLGLDLTPSFIVHPKQECHTSPVIPSISPTCIDSSSMNIMKGRSVSVQSSELESHQKDAKMFNTMDLFAPHELDFNLASPSDSLDTPDHCSSIVQAMCSSAGHGSALDVSMPPSALPVQATPDFVLFPESIAQHTGEQLQHVSSDQPAGAPTSMNMIDTPSPSSLSSPSSPTPSSPPSPSYDDIMMPVVACASCKRSHIKCDHGRPCQNCLKHPSKAANCHDAVPKPRGRPKNGNKTTTGELPVGGRVQLHYQQQSRPHVGFQLVPDNPYRYMHGQPDQHQQPQFYRQRAMSFSQISSLQEPLPYILQSQHQNQPQQQPQHLNQRPSAPQQRSFHYHHPHHLHPHMHQQSSPGSQFYQRSITHPLARYGASEASTGTPTPAVDLYCQSPAHPASPYLWSNNNSQMVPELKSMSHSRTPTLSSSPSAIDIQVNAMHSQPIPVHAGQGSGRYLGGANGHLQAVPSGAMFASLPSQLQSSSAPTLDSYQLHQLQQHKRKLLQYQQQQRLVQRRGSHAQQAPPAPEPQPSQMQHHSFFS